MDWETVTFDMLGRDADDATTALDELNARIQEAVKLVLDMRNTDTAIVVAKVKIKRTGPGGVVVTPQISLKAPARERLGLGAIHAGGELKAIEHKQLDLADVARRGGSDPLDQHHVTMSANGGPAVPMTRDDFLAARRELSAQRRAQGRPAEDEVHNNDD